jgi:hypothetical protein
MYAASDGSDILQTNFCDLLGLFNARARSQSGCMNPYRNIIERGQFMQLSSSLYSRGDFRETTPVPGSDACRHNQAQTRVQLQPIADQSEQFGIVIPKVMYAGHSTVSIVVLLQDTEKCLNLLMPVPHMTTVIGSKSLK